MSMFPHVKVDIRGESWHLEGVRMRDALPRHVRRKSVLTTFGGVHK